MAIATTEREQVVLDTNAVTRLSSDTEQAWRAARLLCVLMMAATGAVFFFAQLELYQTATTRIMDLAYFVQPLEGIRSGYGWEVSIANTIVDPVAEPRSLFAEHLYLLLLAVLPIYLIFPSVYMLFLLQAVVPVFGAYLVFLIARHVTRHPWISLGFAVTYLLYFPFQWSVLNFLHYGFHIENMFPVIFLLGVYLAEVRERHWLAFGVLLVSLTVVESYALLVAAYAVYQLVVGQRRQFGTALLAASTAYLLLAQFVIIPMFRDGGSAYYTEALSRIRTIDGLTSVLSVLPMHVARYGLFILVPLLFLPLLDFRRLLIAAPVVAVNFIALGVEYEVPVSPRSWHTNPITPVVFLAAIGAVATLQSRPGFGRRAVPAAMTVMVGVGVVISVARGPVPAAYGLRDSHHTSYRTSILAEVKPLIPADASLSVDLYLGSHFVQRQQLYVFPDRLDEVEYVLADTRTYPFQEPLILGLLQDDRFHLLFQQDSVFLFRRE